MRRFGICWILSGLAEAPILYSLFYDPAMLVNAPGMSVGLHLGASSILFFCEPRGQGWWHERRLWARTGVVFMAIFSGFGWLAFAAIYWAKGRGTYEATTTIDEAMDFTTSAGTELVLTPTGDRHDRIFAELDMMPFSDIMAGDDIHYKRGAIDRLAELKTPESIALLESYRSDDEMDVRFFVTTALAKVKKDFEEELRAAKEHVRKAKYNLEARCVLARTYLYYGRSHLLDDTTAASYRDEALHHLQFAIMDAEAPSEVFWILIEIYTEQCDWDHLLQVVQVLEGRGMAQPREFLGIRAQALFALGRYAEVAIAMQQVPTLTSPSRELIGLSNWWHG